MNDQRANRASGGVKDSIQFSMRRLMASVTLLAIAAAMLEFLNKIAFLPGAKATIGDGARFAGELGFALWVGFSLCFGVAFALLFKNRRIAIIGGIIVTIVAVLCTAIRYS